MEEEKVEEKSASPLPPKKEAKPDEVKMDFYDAMKELVGGKKIHKLEWADKNFFGELKDGLVKLHKPDGKYYDWIISDGDLKGEDWVII